MHLQAGSHMQIRKSLHEQSSSFASSNKVDCTNAIAVQGIEDHVQLNGKTFKDLPLIDQQNFPGYNICLRIVLPQADPVGVFEVYQRMNTGSENLNAQQVRRAAYRYIILVTNQRQSNFPKWVVLTYHHFVESRPQDKPSAVIW